MLGNARLGMFGRALNKPEEWLGRTDFKQMAAGIAIPEGDTQHAYQYIRRMGQNVEDSLIQMPVVLWEIARSRDADLRPIGRDYGERVSRRVRGSNIEVGEYELFPSGSQAAATVDRLLDRAKILRFSGKSFRQPKEIRGAPLDE